MPWRNPHAPPAQAPVNVLAVMESDFSLMKMLPLRNHRGQIAHVPAVAAPVNVPPVKVADSRVLLLPDHLAAPPVAGLSGYRHRGVSVSTHTRLNRGSQHREVCRAC